VTTGLPTAGPDRPRIRRLRTEPYHANPCPLSVSLGVTTLRQPRRLRSGQERLLDNGEGDRDPPPEVDGTQLAGPDALVGLAPGDDEQLGDLSTEGVSRCSLRMTIVLYARRRNQTREGLAPASPTGERAFTVNASSRGVHDWLSHPDGHGPCRSGASRHGIGWVPPSEHEGRELQTLSV
jgi:hypothetical protein